MFNNQIDISKCPYINIGIVALYVMSQKNISRPNSPWSIVDENETDIIEEKGPKKFFTFASSYFEW